MLPWFHCEDKVRPQALREVVCFERVAGKNRREESRVLPWFGSTRAFLLVLSACWALLYLERTSSYNH